MTQGHTHQSPAYLSTFSTWGLEAADRERFPYIEQFYFRVVDKARQLRPHMHRGIEMVVVIEGSYGFDVEGTAGMLGPSDAMITLPWQQHGGLGKLLSPGKLIWLVIEPRAFTPDGDLVLGNWCSLGQDEQQVMGTTFAARHNPFLGRQDCIRDTMFQLRHALEHRPLYYIAEVKWLLTHLLVLASRHIAHPTTRGACYIPHKVLDVVDRMKQDLSRNWSTKELCAMAGLTAAPLMRWFSLVTGETPRAFLIKERLRKSLQLLKNKSLSITQIAYELGFSSNAHFSSSFKREFGVQPRCYRGIERGIPDVNIGDIISMQNVLENIRRNPEADLEENSVYQELDLSEADIDFMVRALTGMDLDAYRAAQQE